MKCHLQISSKKIFNLSSPKFVFSKLGSVIYTYLTPSSQGQTQKRKKLNSPRVRAVSVLPSEASNTEHSMWHMHSPITHPEQESHLPSRICSVTSDRDGTFPCMSLSHTNINPVNNLAKTSGPVRAVTSLTGEKHLTFLCPSVPERSKYVL